MRIALQTNKMAIIPDFTAMAGSFTFTTGFNSFVTTTMEEARIQPVLITSSTTLAMVPTTSATSSSTTPTTRHSLPCYKGRQIDDTDLPGLSTKLFGLLALTTSRNNNCHEERRYDKRDHRHDNKSKSSRARQFCHQRLDFRQKDKYTSNILFIFDIIFFIILQKQFLVSRLVFSPTRVFQSWHCLRLLPTRA